MYICIYAGQVELMALGHFSNPTHVKAAKISSGLPLISAVGGTIVAPTRWTVVSGSLLAKQRLLAMSFGRPPTSHSCLVAIRIQTPEVMKYGLPCIYIYKHVQ